MRLKMNCTDEQMLSIHYKIKSLKKETLIRNSFKINIFKSFLISLYYSCLIFNFLYCYHYFCNANTVISASLRKKTKNIRHSIVKIKRLSPQTILKDCFFDNKIIQCAHQDKIYCDELINK